MKFKVKGEVDLYEFKVPFKGTFDLDEASILDKISWRIIDNDKLDWLEILTEYVMGTYGPFAIEITECNVDGEAMINQVKEWPEHSE